MLRRPASALAACLAALALAACGGSSSQTFSQPGAPVTFKYPKAYSQVLHIGGAELRKPSFRVTVGTDPVNAVQVSTYTLSRDVSSYKPQDLEAVVSRAASAIARGAGVDVKSREHVKLGPFDGYAYAFSPTQDGVTTRIVFAFDHKTQYFLRCQWNDAGKGDVPAACDQVRTTLKPVAG